VLDPSALADILGAREVPVPARVLRTLADLTWRARLQPTDAGWVDMGRAVPLLDTTRARTELGWSPRHSAADALLELLDGMAHGAGGSTPPMDAQAGGRFRHKEVVTGVGSRADV
jgi:nucleoside-diphosphate-sugar epimerase